jgi:geranylgeranyl pyrophosphate synthase
MWPADQTRLLRWEIERALAPTSGIPDIYALFKELLELRDSTPGAAAFRPWPLLPLIVCESHCGHYEQALPAAAALHLLKNAAEVFDDIEDADNPQSLAAKYGTAVTINAASLLLVLAEKTLISLQNRGVPDDRVIRVIDAVNYHYISAGAGQHLDLSYPRQNPLTENKYLEIARAKSASVFACACQAGALLASADDETIDKYTQFGYDLGMASQIANDIQGITGGSEIGARKITLPAIFVLSQGSSELRSRVEDYFFGPSGASVSPAEISRSLFESGAVYYSLTVMQLYKQKALDFLKAAETSGKNVDPLRLFLE